MNNNHPLPNSMPCTDCQAGQMHIQYLTYFTWLADELITVPNFPTWICDVCGKREYDLRAMNELYLLLNPDAGKPASTVARKRRSPLTGKIPRVAPE